MKRYILQSIPPLSVQFVHGKFKLFALPKFYPSPGTPVS